MDYSEFIKGDPDVNTNSLKLALDEVKNIANHSLGQGRCFAYRAGEFRETPQGGFNGTKTTL